jgi:RHS repeat-associated protein
VSADYEVTGPSQMVMPAVPPTFTHKLYFPIMANAGGVYIPPVNLATARVTYRFNGQQVTVREGVTLTFVYGDHLGSASVTANISGTKISEMRYYPYGEVRYSSGNTATPKRFTSQEEQVGIGLYDYEARFYDPAIGRFISADSIVPKPGDPQNLNRYAYTLNSPLKYIDPTGHDVGCAGASAEACSGWHRSWSGEFELWNWLYESSSWDSYNGALRNYYLHRAATAATALEDGYYSDRLLASLTGVTGAQQQLLVNGYYGENLANKAVYDAALGDYITGLPGVVTVGGNLAMGLSSAIMVGLPRSSESVPNPYGKKGGPEHRAGVSSSETIAQDNGNKFRTEFKVDTPGGQKSHRYVDGVELDVDNNPVAFYQVGRVTENGAPVARERYAIQDIYEYGGYGVPIIFIPYYK